MYITELTMVQLKIVNQTSLQSLIITVITYLHLVILVGASPRTNNITHTLKNIENLLQNFPNVWNKIN